MRYFVRSASVVSRVIAGERLIVPVRAHVGDLASIYGLNEVASSIWQLLASPITKSEIIGALKREFEVDGDRLRCDVEAFLADMQSAGLVSAVEAAAA